jgi:hypothetical protein
MKERIRVFFETHTAISVSVIEKEAEVPADTIRHFLNKQRDLPQKHLDKIIVVLKKYGF